MKIVTSEFQKMVEDLINNLQPNDFPDAEEYKLAQKYNALPLGFDLLAYVFLTSNGDVIWEDYNGEVGSANDSQSLIRLLVGGSRRYPQLAQFIPNRSDESRTCPLCKGAKVLENSKEIISGNPARCFICSGLGWVTEATYLQILKNSK
jgi:hypothetical protein